MAVLGFCPFPSRAYRCFGRIPRVERAIKTRPRLRASLASSSAVVHEQAVASNGPERGSIGPFDDLVELAERHFKRRSYSMIVETVLLTTIQISQLLV